MSELIPRSFLLAGTLAELVRYAIVGLILNFIGYVMYLAVTAYWLSPVVTVSIFYPLSVLAGLFFTPPPYLSA